MEDSLFKGEEITEFRVVYHPDERKCHRQGMEKGNLVELYFTSYEKKRKGISFSLPNGRKIWNLGFEIPIEIKDVDMWITIPTSIANEISRRAVKPPAPIEGSKMFSLQTLEPENDRKVPVRLRMPILQLVGEIELKIGFNKVEELALLTLTPSSQKGAVKY